MRVLEVLWSRALNLVGEVVPSDFARSQHMSGGGMALVQAPPPSVCMFDKFHLTFNFKSKVSRDLFKNKNECQLTYTFNSKMSLNFGLHDILGKLIV